MISALNKRQRWVYLLTLINVMLIVAIAITLKVDKTSAEKNQLKFNDVNSMEWRREGIPDIVFNRSNEQWQITSPCALPVNNQRLEPLLDALANHGDLYAADSVDRLAAGLESPQATLVINGQETAIGEKDISGEYRYLQYGATVTLVPEWVLSLVNSGLTGVADLTVFNDDVTTIKRKDNNAAIATEVFEDESLATLSANQIVIWPIPDLPEITGSVSLEAMYQDGHQETLELTTTNSFAVIRRVDSHCAHVLQPDAVPNSLTP